MADDLDAQAIAEDLAPWRDKRVGTIRSARGERLGNGRVRTEQRDEAVSMCGDLLEGDGHGSGVGVILCGMHRADEPA